MTLKSKPALTFGDTEIFVMNTFLHVGELLSAQVHGSYSEPAKTSQENVSQDEDVVVPWKTYDSYEDDHCEELMVKKVSTLEYFEMVQAFERRAERSFSEAMEPVSTFDSFEDGPISADFPVAKVYTVAVEQVKTFDWLEDSEHPECPGDAVIPQKSELSTAPPETTTPPASPSRAPVIGVALEPPLSSCIRGGKELFYWRVDGRKLDTQEKQILSPQFDLSLPGLDEPRSFRLMILAKETRGKGGKGFLKAKGHGRLFIKTVGASVPEGVPPISFRVTIGGGAEKDQPAHDFSQHSCCPLQEGNRSWDLLSLLDATSKRFEVSVQVL